MASTTNAIEALSSPMSFRVLASSAESSPMALLIRFRRRMAAAGYGAYLEHWSESAVVPRYLQLVQDAARKKGLTELAAASSGSPSPSPTP